MRSVADILREKNVSKVHCIEPGRTVYDAIRLMADKGVGALVVVEAERIVGIISERDYARKIVLMDRSSRTTTVAEIMSPDPVCVSRQARIPECLALMTERRFRHLPVVDDGRLEGVVSIGDLVKDTMETQKALIRQLESYIRGE